MRGKQTVDLTPRSGRSHIYRLYSVNKDEYIGEDSREQKLLETPHIGMVIPQTGWSTNVMFRVGGAYDKLRPPVISDARRPCVRHGTTDIVNNIVSTK